jgi:hypothetical protein
MLRSLARSCVLPFVASLAPLAAQTEDAARLVPGGASVLVRIESAQVLNELVRGFAPLSAELASFDLQAKLDEMRGPGSDPAEAPALDPALPLYFAVGFDPASGPVLTFVAPVTNGKPFHFPGPLGAQEHDVQLGTYTGVSTAASYAAAAAPSPLVAALRPGVVSVHFDLAALLQLYRPFLDMGLAQAEASLDQMPSDELPFDPQPMMEAYLGAARTILDSAEALDLAVQKSGDEIALQLDFHARAGSALDGWASGKRADLAQLAGYADPQSSFQGVFNGNWGELFERFEGFMDSVVEVYPEPLRADMQALLGMNTQLAPLLEPGLAYSFDIGGEGMRGAYVVRSEKPAEVAAAIEKMLRQLDHPGGFLHVGAPERFPVDGFEARVLPLTLDYGAILQTIAAAAPAGAQGAPGMSQPAPEEFQRMMEAVYGRTPRLALAQHGERVGVAVASNDAYLRDALARLKAPATPGPKLQRLLERAAPGSLAFLYHLDFGRTMGQMFEAFSGFMPGPALPLPADPFSLDLWGSIHERTWSGGFAMDVEELIDFVRAMEEVGSAAAK